MTESYIIKKYLVEARQYTYIAQLTEGLHQQTYELFCHFLRSNLIESQRTWEEAWSPVPWETINKSLRNAKWKDLQGRGLIEASGYSKQWGRCRKYQVNPDIVKDFLAFAPRTYSKYKASKKVNLMTGKPCVYTPKTIKVDSSKNPLPKLIVDAMETISECIVNLPAMEQRLVGLEQELNGSISPLQKFQMTSWLLR